MLLGEFVEQYARVRVTGAVEFLDAINARASYTRR